MAFLDAANKEVIDQTASLIHKSFNRTVSSQTKITASDGASNDFFGITVAVGCGRIVVGQFSFFGGPGSAYIFDLDGNELVKVTPSDTDPSDSFGTTIGIGNGRIVIGNTSDDDIGSNAGAAYIYDLDGNQLAKITASDGAAGDGFGGSIAVGCGRIVIGAPSDDDNGSSSGSVYIFDLDGNELKKIIASDGAADDRFGGDVAVGNGRIIVSSIFDDDNGTDSGSAYIFDLNGNQIKKITASDAAAGDNFGGVAVGSGRIVVGAIDDDDNGTNSGSAYIFDLNGNQLAKLTASDGATADGFGISVGVSGGKIVVGAWQDDTSRGSIYVFDLDGNQLEKITAFDRAIGDQFGRRVSIGSSRIVSGAWQGDDNGTNSGSAYINFLKDDYNTYIEEIIDTKQV